MSLRCILCGHETAHALGKRSDFSHTESLEWSYREAVADVSRFDRPIVRCATCGFQFIDPLYDESDLAALYQQDGYFRSQKLWRRHARKITGRGRKRTVGSLQRKFEAVGIATWKESFLSTKQGNPSFLDVGCGLGTNLVTFQEMGFDVLGIDLSPYQVDYVTQRLGLPAQLSALEEFQPSRQFDCVLASHLIEHVALPHVFMDKVLSLLSPKGLLLVETPFLADWGRVEGRYADIYHSLFFDHFTLTLLGSMHGLQLRGVSHVTWRLGTMYHVYMLLSFNRSEVLDGVDLTRSQLEWLRQCYDASHDAISQWGRKQAGNIWQAGWAYLRHFGIFPTLRGTAAFLRRKLMERNGFH